MARFLLRGALSLAMLVASAAAAEPVRTVILVRHAERAGGMAASAGISEAGRCRAEVLAGMLADAGVKRIYVSEVERTQQTAAPLANRLGIQPEAIPAGDIDALVGKLRSGTAAGVALVVGHSNTLPQIIGRLGGDSVATIGDSEYDRMYVVTTASPNQTSVVLLHYPGCEK